MKVIDSKWFTQMGKTDTIGIVSGLDEITGEVKIYIGTAPGYSEQNDAQHILKTGAKLNSLDITNFTILSNMKGQAIMGSLSSEDEDGPS